MWHSLRRLTCHRPSVRGAEHAARAASVAPGSSQLGPAPWNEGQGKMESQLGSVPWIEGQEKMESQLGSVPWIEGQEKMESQ
jgi:hypothetical protein